MKKVYKIEVDCPQCAAKAEKALRSMDGISSASVNLMTQKAIIVFEDCDIDQTMKQAKKLLHRIDDDIVLYC